MPVANPSLEQLLALKSAAFDAAANAIVITDHDGTVVWANSAFSALSGYTVAEAVGRNPRDLVKSGVENPVVFERMWAEILAGRTWHGELTNRRKDGSHYREEMTITPVCAAGGEITHFIAIKQDLTARTQAAEAMIASELRYRRLFESARDGILILDAESGAIVDVNPYLVDRLGFPREQFLGKRLWELGFFKDIVANQDSFAELQQSEYIRYEDKPLETADGQRVDVEFVSNVYLVNRLKVIQCNIRDITVRKAGERRLREQNEILSNSHEGVMVVDRSNRISLWNRGAEDIFGWNAEEAIGRTPEQALGVDDAVQVASLREAVERHGFWNGEVRGAARDGRRLDVDCRITLVRDEAGQPRGRLNFLTDVTEKKLREKIYLRAQRLEAVGTLSSGLAHDLNNILTPILMAAGMLREGSSDEHHRQLLGLIEASAHRGADIIRQLLTFGRGIEGQRVHVQLRHLIREMAGIVRETFPRSIRLSEDAARDLWPVVADATQLHQVLMNLCVNARDAMPDGGLLTIAANNIRLEAHDSELGVSSPAGPYVRITIRDSGLGIPREVIDRIFEPFFTTKGLGQGSGLGLSTVLGIVRSHGGSVTVYSELANGSVFHVYLPAVPDAVTDRNAQEGKEVTRGHGETILVIDDEPAILAAARHCLLAAGYTVITAKNGEEGLVAFLAERNKVRVVVTDVMMPVMDGLKLARALRKLDARVRVIASSGLDPATGAKDFAEGFIAEFLSKPYEQGALLAAVGRQVTATRDGGAGAAGKPE